MNPITGLEAVLAALTAFYVGAWSRLVAAARRNPNAPVTPATETGWPTPVHIGVGAVTNFFDTLGIGSFATTTALFRALRLVPDRVIPGTLNVGHTLPTVAQTYGHFEVRARLPRGKGLWPAVWMLPADHTWPPEIDVVESIGDPRTAYVTAHSKAVASKSVEVKVGDDGFHTYAVSWDPQWLKWYLDGVETARQATPADMHKPMYLIANLAVGGKWPGAPDASTRFPASLDLDFVRIYQFQKPAG